MHCITWSTLTDVPWYDCNIRTSIGSVCLWYVYKWSFYDPYISLQCLTYCNRINRPQQDLWYFLLWQLSSSVSDHTRGECKSCCGVLQPSARQGCFTVHVEDFFVIVKCCKWQGIFIIFHLKIRDDTWHTSSNHQWINYIGLAQHPATTKVASNKIQRCWKMSRLSRDP